MKNNIPQGYKATALGIIPQEWEVKSLNKACDFLDSQRIPIKDSERAKISGIYPYYGASGIIDYVNNYIFNDDLILLAEDGANIINRSTPIAFLVNGKIWVNNHSHVLKAKPSFDRYYLCAYLESLKYDKYNTGTAQPKLNREVCEKIPILAPPLAEQRKIAEVLGVWDEAIEKQARLIEKLALRKRALMQRLLSAKLRLPGFSEPWKEQKINKITTIKKGEQVNKDVLFSNAKYPVINGGITPSGYLDTYNTKANTITISEGGNSCGYVNFMTTPFWSGGHCYTIDAKDGINNLFIYQLLKNNEKYIMSLRVGSGLPNIQIKDLGNIKFMIPTYQEQTAIAEVLTAADREIELAKEKLERLRRQKRGLMQQLLTGKKRVKY